MKIKLKVWALAYDTRGDGTGVEMFSTEAALQERQKQIVLNELERYGNYPEAAEVSELIKAGEIGDAWDSFEDNVRDSQDTYCVEEEELEFEINESELAKALKSVASYGHPPTKAIAESALGKWVECVDLPQE